jgi:hypothetical protein
MSDFLWTVWRAMLLLRASRSHTHPAGAVPNLRALTKPGGCTNAALLLSGHNFRNGSGSPVHFGRAAHQLHLHQQIFATTIKSAYSANAANRD